MVSDSELRKMLGLKKTDALPVGLDFSEKSAIAAEAAASGGVWLAKKTGKGLWWGTKTGIGLAIDYGPGVAKWSWKRGMDSNKGALRGSKKVIKGVKWSIYKLSDFLTDLSKGSSRDKSQLRTYRKSLLKKFELEKKNVPDSEPKHWLPTKEEFIKWDKEQKAKTTPFTKLKKKVFEARVEPDPPEPSPFSEVKQKIADPQTTSLEAQVKQQVAENQAKEKFQRWNPFN